MTKAVEEGAGFETLEERDLLPGIQLRFFDSLWSGVAGRKAMCGESPRLAGPP